MPLFGGKRDISMFRHINKELLWDVITQQVAFYKLELSKTKFNIYGEAPHEKFYSQPVLVSCLIERGDQSYVEDDFGTDLEWSHVFRFLNDDLEDARLLPEIGDIILYENKYYELYRINRNQLFVGKDPDKAAEPNPYNDEIKDFGYNVSTICYAHYTPKDKVGIDLNERII
jgi:hypothetical protein